MSFCDFAFFKAALSKRLPTKFCGFWKAVQEEWDKIPLLIPQKSLLSWKLRCRKIVKNVEYQVEHLKHKNITLNSSAIPLKSSKNVRTASVITQVQLLSTFCTLD
ncbi:hypothetical protein AVEN_246923-1 [Araneus ventricosus]|uniref:Uncharacterized protein n=1 Tax=Araneus ventricosus TaxID=182803 RepID=A0A4Y2HN06_ARAVE|nr:hypothetical protein AVEN_246923-1 [Araneus ventricosus]